MSQNAFWGFLAASQKNVQKVSGKCPGAGAGAGKMSRKCQKSVPQTFSRHFFDTFWQIESGGLRPPPKRGRARASRARPLSVLYLPKSVRRLSGKCLGDTFLIFSGHFSSASPSTRTLSRHFLDIFLGGCQEAPKGILGDFSAFFGNFSFLTTFNSSDYYKSMVQHAKGLVSGFQYEVPSYGSESIVQDALVSVSGFHFWLQRGAFRTV